MQEVSTERSRSSPAPRTGSAAWRRSSSRARARASWSTISAPSGDGARPRRDRPRARWWRRSAKQGGEAVPHFGDVADWNDAQALIKTALDTFGELHILVNNAGFLRDSIIFNMTEEDFDAVIRVHLKGHFCTMRFATAYWRDKAKASGGRLYGRLINTSSEAFIFGSRGAAELRGGQGGDRGHDHVGRAGADQVRRHRQRDHAARAHAHERGRPAEGDVREAGRRLRRLRAGERGAAGRLSRLAGARRASRATC